MVRRTTFYFMIFWASFIFFLLATMTKDIYSSVDPSFIVAKPRIETLFEEAPPTYNDTLHKAAALDRIIDEDAEYMKKKFIKDMDLVTLHAFDPKMVKEKMESKDTDIMKEIHIAINKIAKKHKMDPKLIRAIIETESEFKYKAVSKEQAKGLMQIMPDTARKLGVRDRFNPVDNIDGGTRYISYLIKLYKGDVQLALAAYNAGPGRVQEHGFTIPPIKETQDYVVKVMSKYNSYKGGRG